MSCISFITPLLTNQKHLTFLSFLLFELSVGMFWPSISSLKGKYIPEQYRSTIMNYFRIPTNLVVLVVMSNVKNIPINYIFLMCSIFVFISFIFQYLFVKLISRLDSIETTTTN